VGGLRQAQGAPNTAKGGLRCGFGSADITPRKRCELAGYGPDLGRTWDEILDPLSVRVLLLERGAHRLLIGSFDVLGLTPGWVRRLKREVARTRGIAPRHVLLAAIHTHSAPAAQPLRHWGKQVPETLPRMERGFFMALRRAERTLRPVAAVSERSARASNLLFNRDPFAEEVPPEERTDPTLKALLFHSPGAPTPKGAACATRALVTFACHPVVLGPNRGVSADYPGALLSELKAAGIEALFLLGTHGDADPIVQKRKGWGRGIHADATRMGRSLARRLQRSRPKPLPLESFPLAGRQWDVPLPLDIPSLSALRRVEDEARRKAEAEPGRPARMHTMMVEWARAAQAAVRSGKAPRTQRVPLQLLQLGPVHILGIPMEVYAGVGAQLRKALAPRPVWVVSGANGTVNYLPTRLAYERNVYSAHFAPKIYGVFGYRPTLSDVVVKSVLDHVR
jgi:neutral ceramidase